MATSYPASLDSFTNPTAVDTLDSPPHDTQHADANDAIEAIETALLDGAPLHIDDANERVGVGNVSPSYKLDVTGDINASGALRIGGSEIGARVSFTPSWRAGLTIGNGSNQWYYLRINQYILVWGTTSLGSTSAVTGGISMDLPTGGSHTNQYAPCGQSFARDATGGAQYTGQALPIGADYVAFYITYTGGSYANNTNFSSSVPFTWTTGDVFGAMFFYRQVP